MLHSLRVVVASADHLTRIGLRTLLQNQPDIQLVNECCDLQSVFSICTQLVPDVLLLAVSHPVASFIECVQRLRAQAPRVATMILAPEHNLRHFIAFAEAGVTGYFVSTEPLEPMIHALFLVATGGVCFPSSVLPALLKQNETTWQTEPLLPAKTLTLSVTHDLTPRECEVLSLVAKGWSNEQIGSNLGVAERTIRFHTRNIYDKMNFKQRSEAISWAIKQNVG